MRVWVRLRAAIRVAAAAGLVTGATADAMARQAPAASPPAPAAAQPAGADNVDQSLARALTMQQAGDLIGAIQAYQIVLQTDPSRADVRSNLGAAYVALGRFDDGMKEYKAAIASDPENATYHFNLGLALYKAGQPDDAIPEFDAVLKKDPSNKNARLLSADSKLQLGKDAEVIALLSPYQNEFQTDLGFAYVLGMAMIRSGQTEQGQVLIDRIFKAGESAEGHLLMGLAYLNKLDYKSALPELARAVAMNPRLPTAHTLYGRALLGNADQESASRQYTLALELNPNDFEANLQMGNIRHREQRFEDAMAYLDRAIAIRPDDLAVRQTMASALLGQGQVDRAKGILEGIVKQQPDFVDAHVLLASAYYRLKRKDDGDRERALVARLTAENQAKQPGAKAVDGPPAPPTPAPRGTAGSQ
jgi:Tfp pilus assembly protein PilF